MQVVITFKIPDILLDQPNGMHVVEISKRSGVEQGKLGRILRLLATKHVFREGALHCFTFSLPLKAVCLMILCVLVTKDVFANNRLSMQLLSTNPLSNLGLYL